MQLYKINISKVPEYDITPENKSLDTNLYRFADHTCEALILKQWNYSDVLKRTETGNTNTKRRNSGSLQPATDSNMVPKVLSSPPI